jgi:hypothetical protein
MLITSHPPVRPAGFFVRLEADMGQTAGNHLEKRLSTS